jgi:agmatine/peptidylarginine deiminase
MKKTLLFTLATVFSGLMMAQEMGFGIPEGTLPKWTTEDEYRFLEEYGFNPASSRGITDPPDYDNLRNMAEWEELQALTIAWISYPDILKQIVQHAMDETMVIIITEDMAETLNFLNDPSTGLGAITDYTNINIVTGSYDSVWMRDYAGNPVYGNEVDDLIMVDWIYNRPNRPNDDASPEIIANELGLDLYCITEAPTDLVNTGGNYMSDGFGNAFASKLILSENAPGNEYGVTSKTSEEIDEILLDWLGIQNYIKMETLPYDAIHHIDMHMKLLDEETILLGEFPENVSDGPQIQANIEYVLSNYTTRWGTPWKVVWMPMPSSTGGGYPDGTWGGAAYRTYTNSVFVNETIIVPTYREEYDTTAMRIYNEVMPGYNIVGIDCDNQPEAIINASGAIHCITHSVGVFDPLLISHNALEDTDDDTNDYLVEAYVKHRDGISSATLFWKLDEDSDYNEVEMTNIGGDDWEAYIPAQNFGSTVHYYIRGEATSGKVQVRPMPAPEGYFDFRVMTELVDVAEGSFAEFMPVYPNPASAITVVPLAMTNYSTGTLKIFDMMGRQVQTIHSGGFQKGESKFFFDASVLSSGMYAIVLETEASSISQKFVVQ